MSHSCPLPPWQSWCQRRVGKERVFHEKDRRIGMLAADSGIEFIGTLSHLLHGSIGHKVEDKHRSVHTGYDIGNLQVEQGIAANPRLMHSRLSQRSRILVCAMPGREAQPPCKMLVP